MVVVGVDAHKRTHTLVGVDEAGRKLGEKTVAATPEGHLEAVEWAMRWPERQFALEDCRHVTRRLESDLLAAGEAVVRVPTRLMAGARRSVREQGKSDPIDALSVARAALREPDLPVARLDGEARQVRLLVDHRDDLVRERTRIQCRLRWHLHELFPGLVIPPKSLRRQNVLTELEARLADVVGTVAAITRELLGRCRELTLRANELEHEISRARETPGPGPPRAAGLRRALGSQDHRRVGRCRSVPLQGRLRPVERHGAGASVVGQHTVPLEPQRQPPSQRRAAPHRHHAVARRRRQGSRVRRAADGYRRHQDRSTSPPPSTAVRRDLPSAPPRRAVRGSPRRRRICRCRLT